jgi:hypothetical protein
VRPYRSARFAGLYLLVTRGSADSTSWQNQIDKWIPFNASGQIWATNAHAGQSAMFSAWTGFAVFSAYAGTTVAARLVASAAIGASRQLCAVLGMAVMGSVLASRTGALLRGQPGRRLPGSADPAASAGHLGSQASRAAFTTATHLSYAVGLAAAIVVLIVVIITMRPASAERAGAPPAPPRLTSCRRLTSRRICPAEPQREKLLTHRGVARTSGLACLN